MKNNCNEQEHVSSHDADLQLYLSECALDWMRDHHPYLEDEDYPLRCPEHQVPYDLGHDNHLVCPVGMNELLDHVLHDSAEVQHESIT